MRSDVLTRTEPDDDRRGEPPTVGRNERLARLSPAESIILDQYGPYLIGRRVLDLGIGEGRTTPWLAPSAGSYIGIDHRPVLVERCRARYRRWTFVHCDPRDMPIFPNRCFDFVLAASNSIDGFVHDDRLRVLREVARVLVRGGIFAFSSHNVAWSRPARLRVLRSVFFPDPATAGRPRRNARPHACEVQPYRTSPEAQRIQLREAGFSACLQLFPEHGTASVTGDQPHSYYYVTCKA